MSAQHTQGRLAYQEDSDAYTHILRDQAGRIVASTPQSSRPPCEADARRLAACWNACKDISTEALERGPTPTEAFVREEARADLAGRQLDELTAQHDKLLAEFAAYKEGSEEAFGAVVDAKQALERRKSQFDSTIESQGRVIVDIRTQRDELLEALSRLEANIDNMNYGELRAWVKDVSSAAIAKANGSQA